MVVVCLYVDDMLTLNDYMEGTIKPEKIQFF